MIVDDGCVYCNFVVDVMPCHWKHEVIVDKYMGII